MASPAPTVLILGHSFIKRLRKDLEKNMIPGASPSFHLEGFASIHMNGVGGRTVASLRNENLNFIRQLKPDVLILEMGTNDLIDSPPEVVGSAIDDLVTMFLEDFPVQLIIVCQVIPRGSSYSGPISPSEFARRAKILNDYTTAVLGQYPRVICWSHRHFNHPNKDLYDHRGVHLNPLGQYFLYRSLRGAILKGVRKL